MVSISDTWDRTSEVLSGRRGVLCRIALVAIVLPAAVQAAFTGYAVPGGSSTAYIAVLIATVAALLTIWAQVAITAVASDPATTERAAVRVANARFLPALAVFVVAGIVALVVMVPMFVAVGMSGLNMTAMGEGLQPAMAPGAIVFAAFYFALFCIAILFAAARLFVLNPLIVNERRGLDVYARSWALTRGMTWKLVGVYLLFAVLGLVTASAAKYVVGVPLRLMLGSDAVPVVTLVVGVLGGIVTAIYVVVVATFATQLYLAKVGQHPAVRHDG